ncbi:MAG: family 31 glucosidase [Clostridiaceae bacterium]|nr:family 31 glucosidase [Clostridiaceae bacterium]
MLRIENNRLIFNYDAEEVSVEAWGRDGVRIRACKSAVMPDENWALLQPPVITVPSVVVSDGAGTLTNGQISVHVTHDGRIEVTNAKGKTILREYWRNRRDVTHPDCSALEVEAREFKPIIGGNYRLTYRIDSLDRKEKIFGMGQYQQPYLDLKGTDLEMAHRNSQASIPFFVSSLGYGMLWNNPAVGRAVFGHNTMSFEAESTKLLDIWLTVGDTPAEIVEKYADITGKVPMMPEYGLGFWQCKLRYQTQEELLNIAREYKKRNLPLDVIVADFFHWPKQGDWRFDSTYWPDPEAMISELKSMGIELMVSIWPTVDYESENFQEMLERGYLIRTERGIRIGMNFEGDTIHFDATNPGARDFIWDKAKKNYYQKGVRLFWLDEAEPEYTVYDFENYRYYLGTDLEIGNIYPVEYARAFYEGMAAEGQTDIVNLLRCAWAGSQKYGALVWSGDIASSFSSMKNQLTAGLNIGMAWIPWWTTDIGGFHGGDPNDSDFRELFIRWFEWGTFCPVMRLHGDREPKQPQYGTTGGAHCRSGADNEVWSYGGEAYEICCKYLAVREQLRDYTRRLMQQAHEKGTPVMRTLFYEFPEDKTCWEVEDQYMYGDEYLVAPILEHGARSRQVYLPAGRAWKDFHGDQQYEGGQWIEASAPISIIPVYQKI